MLRIILGLVMFCCGFYTAAADQIVLLDGSRIGVESPVGLEKNMLVFRRSAGNKMLLSKALVDWPQTWRKMPAMVARFYPDMARVLASKKEARKARLIRQGKNNIQITNESLQSLKPGQGLVAHWESDLPTETANGRSKGLSSGKSKLTRSAKLKSGGPIIEVITKSKRVELKQHLEADRFVIFDFYANWCGPCRKLTPKLEAMARKYPDKVALKKIDIVRWGTPVAKQYGIKSIPYVRLYDRSGRHIKSGRGTIVLQHLKKIARREKW